MCRVTDAPALQVLGDVALVNYFNDGNRGTGTRDEMAVEERTTLAFEGVVVASVDVKRSAPGMGLLSQLDCQVRWAARMHACMAGCVEACMQACMGCQVCGMGAVHWMACSEAGSGWESLQSAGGSFNAHALRECPQGSVCHHGLHDL